MQHPVSAAILGLIEDVRDGIVSLPQFHPITDHDLVWQELVFCVASSQESAKRARRAADELGQATGWLPFDLDKAEATIDGLLRDRGILLRFHSRKVRQLAASWIQYSIDAELLGNPAAHFRAEEDARVRVISTFPGMGPKQSSMFLRNIGSGSTLAVIDSHVAWAIEVAFGLQAANTSLSRYVEAEKAMRSFADAIGLTMASLDVVLWSAARACRHMQRLGVRHV